MIFVETENSLIWEDGNKSFGYSMTRDPIAPYLIYMFHGESFYPLMGFAIFRTCKVIYREWKDRIRRKNGFDGTWEEESYDIGFGLQHLPREYPNPSGDKLFLINQGIKYHRYAIGVVKTKTDLKYHAKMLLNLIESEEENGS